MKIRDDYTCPLEIVHDIIKGKWKTIILYQLKDGPKGLSELEREIEGITQKMLLEQLKELMQFGLVDKKTYEGYPLRVEYFLVAKITLQTRTAPQPPIVPYPHSYPEMRGGKKTTQRQRISDVAFVFNA